LYIIELWNIERNVNTLKNKHVSNKFSIAFELALEAIHNTNSVSWKGPLKTKPMAKAYIDKKSSMYNP